jgi:hypothetical protein
MLLNVSSSTKRVIVAYAAIVAILAGVLWLSIEATNRPVEDTGGVVEAVTFGPPTPASGVNTQTAIVRRSDGTLVQAQVPAFTLVHSGDKVKVLGYQRFFSTARTYEIVAESSK